MLPALSPSLIVSYRAALQAEDRRNAAVPPVRTDLYGDPLPPGAIARIGTSATTSVRMSGDIVLSPDGKTITATSGWFVILLRLWDLETGRVTRHLTNLEDRAGHAKLQMVAFSPDGKLIATGDSAGVGESARRTRVGKSASFSGLNPWYGWLSFLTATGTWRKSPSDQWT